MQFRMLDLGVDLGNTCSCNISFHLVPTQALERAKHVSGRGISLIADHVFCNCVASKGWKVFPHPSSSTFALQLDLCCWTENARSRASLIARSRAIQLCFVANVVNITLHLWQSECQCEQIMVVMWSRNINRVGSADLGLGCFRWDYDWIIPLTNRQCACCTLKGRRKWLLWIEKQEKQKLLFDSFLNPIC